MSRKWIKVLLLGAIVMSAFASSSASAATWTSNGSASGTPFTATTGAVVFRLAGVSPPIRCTNLAVSGLLYGPTGTVGVNRAANLSFSFTACTVGFAATVSCPANTASLWPTSYGSPTLSGTLNANAGAFCTVAVPAVPGCTVTIFPTNGVGTAFTPVSYVSSTGTLTIRASGQALTTSWFACGSLFTAGASMAATTMGNVTGGDLVLRVTSAFVPNITI